MHAVPHRESLVSQTVEILLKSIDQGRWLEHLPGEHALCAEMQISRETLRRALAKLTDDGWLSTSQGRRRQILKPSSGAMARAKIRRVVLLSQEPMERMGGAVMFLVDDLRAELARAGLELEVRGSRTCFSKKPDKALERLTSERPNSVWVLSSVPAPTQRWFAARGLPSVLAGSHHAGLDLPMVAIDFRAVGRHAAGLFLSRGHRRMAVLAPKLVAAGDVLTVEGFSEACATKQDAQVRVVEHDGTPAGIARKLQTLWQGTPPTGLMVLCSNHALTALTGLMRAGVRVPQDVSIIAQDSDPTLAWALPSLTRYAIKPAVFVRQLARSVLALARGVTPSPKQYLLFPTHVRGETLGRMSGERTS
jgi:LacI family transcriptional regulator